MQLSRERIQEMKDLLEKKGKREYTWEEASEAAHNLAGFAEIAFDSWQEDQRRKRELQENPKGFVLDGVGYTCGLCRGSAHEGDGWYTKWGVVCTICKTAIDTRKIPGSLVRNRESWYTPYDLESRFNLKTPIRRQWVTKGILKARTIPTPIGTVHTELFLIKDNKDFLPPKKLTESRMVKETKDGKDWYHTEPWYKFVNPEEHLKGYRILEHVKVTHPV